MKLSQITKTCRHTQVDSLMASYQCCTIEGSYPIPLPDRLFHRICLMDLAYRKFSHPGRAYRNSVIQEAQVRTMEGSYLPAISNRRVRRLLDSLHDRIRAVIQPKVGHMPYLIRCYSILSPVNCSKINPYVNIPICSYANAGNKNANFCLLFSFI